ncbi:MAG: carboxypeptidase regulatory-like domain-containing protein [bacterium]|nr:carboxypeptidase regulatory-like domain-containing protein [bacterium]
MNARSLFLLAILAFAGAGVWLFTSTLDGGASGEFETLDASSDPIGPGAPLGPAAELETLAEGASVGPEVRSDATADVQDVERIEGVAGGLWRAPRGSVWIGGRVELPEGTPLDEKLFVTAKGATFTNRSDGGKEMRVAVDDQGAFRVALAKKTRVGRLYLEGRYLFLKNPKKVRLRDALDEEIVLEPKLGGRLVVTLLAPATHSMDAGVFDGAEVVASVGRGFGSAQTEGKRTSDESVFEIGGLEADKEHIVRASSPIFADGELEEVEVTAGGVKHVDVAYSVGIKIAGEVFDHEGNPLRDAMVLVMTENEASSRNPIFNEGQQNTKTDRRGAFELLGAEPGELALVVEAEGFLDHTYEMGELRDGQRQMGVRLQLDRGELLSGVIKWPDGEPAAGAEVRVSQEWGRGGFQIDKVVDSVVVGATGGFEFSALTEKKCVVTATCLPRGLTQKQMEEQGRLLGDKVLLWSATKAEVAPGSMNLVLTLRPGDTIEGRIVDDRGEPVERFKVVATPAGDNMISSTSLKPVRERFKDERGHFELEGLQPAEWVIRVTAVGYGTPDEQKIKVPYSGGPLRFTAPRSGSVSGVVVDPSGDPVHEARVLIDHGSRTAAATTDREGKFDTTKIVPGWIDVRATADGYGQTEPVRMQIAASGDVDNLRLALTPGAVIRGELHASVEEHEGRSISLRGKDDSNEFGQQRTNSSVETDEDGRFEFTGLSAGTYVVRLEQAFPRGRGRGGAGRRSSWIMRLANQVEAEVVLEVGAEEFVTLGEPPATAVRVFGKITRGSESVGDAMVTCFPRGAEGNDPVGAVFSDDGGNYEMTLEESGEYRFMVGEPGSQASFYETVEEGEEQRIDFEIPTGSIVGKVTGPDGEPLEGVLVTLDDPDNDASMNQRSWLGRRTEATDAEGEYVFDDISPDVPYVLRAGASFGFNTATEGLSQHTQSDVKLSGEETRRIDIELKRSGWIEGLVVDRSGTPVERAEIIAVDGAGVPISLRTQRSRANGTFRYDGLAPGNVTVYAKRGGAEGERVEVRVLEGVGAEARLIAPDED